MLRRSSGCASLPASTRAGEKTVFAAKLSDRSPQAVNNRMFPTNSNDFLRIPKDSYGFLGIHRNSFEFQCIPRNPQESRLVLTQHVTDQTKTCSRDRAVRGFVSSSQDGVA